MQNFNRSIQLVLHGSNRRFLFASASPGASVEVFRAPLFFSFFLNLANPLRVPSRRFQTTLLALWDCLTSPLRLPWFSFQTAMNSLSDFPAFPFRLPLFSLQLGWLILPSFPSQVALLSLLFLSDCPIFLSNCPTSSLRLPYFPSQTTLISFWDCPTFHLRLPCFAFQIAMQCLSFKTALSVCLAFRSRLFFFSCWHCLALLRLRLPSLWDCPVFLLRRPYLPSQTALLPIQTILIFLTECLVSFWDCFKFPFRLPFFF